MSFLYNVFGVLLFLWIMFSVVISLFLTNAIFNRNSSWYQKQGHKLVSTPDTDSKQKAVEMTQKKRGDDFWNNSNKQTCSAIAPDKIQLSGCIFHPINTSNKWILCIHGYRSNGKSDMAYSVSKLVEQGYHCLVPDLRGHGESEGEAIGMGGPEQLDIHAWLHYIRNLNSNASILLYGDSMGAATVLIALNKTLPTYVKGAIADCGYTCLKDEFQYLLTHALKLPFTFPIIPMVAILYKMKFKQSFFDVSPAMSLKHNNLPILFIHGTGDHFVPAWMSESNAKTTLGTNTLILIKDAPHFSSIFYDEDTYFSSIFSFLNNTL